MTQVLIARTFTQNNHPLLFWVYCDLKSVKESSVFRARRQPDSVHFSQGEEACYYEPNLCILISNGTQCCLKDISCRMPYAVFNAASARTTAPLILMCAVTPGAASLSATGTASPVASAWLAVHEACCALNAPIYLTQQLDSANTWSAPDHA